jgi:hypothetical protein
MHFSSLYLTHFGRITDVSRHLSDYALHVEQVHDTVERLLETTPPGPALHGAFEKAEHAAALQAGASEADWAHYQLANPTSMCADGIALYIEKSREAS